MEIYKDKNDIIVKDEDYIYVEEKALKADVRIIQRPFEIRIDCPYCDYEVSMSYGDFEDLMPSDYPVDWTGEKIKCSNCEKEIEIDGNEWD